MSRTIQLVTIAWVTLACGDPASIAEATAVAFAIQSGDGQLSFPNRPLPERLAARLVDRDGSPVLQSGRRVEWKITAGDGTVTGVGDTTSALGAVSADVVLGPSEGVTRVVVAADRIASVEFSARATLPGPIVFVSNRRTGIVGDDVGGYPGDLFVMNEDGSDIVGLFDPRFIVQSLFDPVWSPSGESILFVRTIGRPAGGVPGLLRIGLFEIKPNGSDESQIPAAGLPPYVQYYADPEWSPDASEILVYLAAEGGNDVPPELTPGALHIVPSSGTDARPLDGVMGTARAPSWDVATRRIAFECAGGATRAICIVKGDGTGLVQLTDGAVPDTDPVWSPDGSQLLFARDTLSGGGIWLMREDGTGLRRIVEGRAMSPSWSLNGERFVFEWHVSGQIDVWLYDLTTDTAINLTNAASRDSEPAWRW